MGTRHLTIVKKNNEYKVAQYGQWDGYPEYTGVKVLDFCKRQMEADGFSSFRNFVDNVHYVPKDFFDGIHFRDYAEQEEWLSQNKEFSRDLGCGILDMICEREGNISLINHIEFAADSLWCEWAWMLDFDTNTLRCFKGFNENPLAETEEFKFLDTDDTAEYRPIIEVNKFSFDNLPETDEEFLQFFVEKEEAEKEEEEE